MTLSNHVDASITRVSGAVTQQGFSTPLVLAYHDRWTDERVREYASVEEAEGDGFISTDPVHKILSELFAQPEPPASVKVGRRASAFTQTLRLTPTAANSTAFTIEVDGIEATYTSDASGTVAEITAGLHAAIAALADVDAIIATGASSASSQTLSGASLDGATGYRTMSPPRRLSFTFSSHADWDATTITVTGKDADGGTLTETFSVTNGGGTTATGSKLFARVTSVAIPAQTGAGGTFTMGVRAPITSSDDTTHVTLTNVAGYLASLEVTGAGVIAIEDRTADPGIASDLSACRAEDDDWYGLLLDSNSSAEIQAAATPILAASPKKILVAQTADTETLDSTSIIDVAYVLSDAGNDRVVVLYHPTVALNWAAAALVGSAIAYDPGTVNWKFRELAGISNYRLTSSEQSAALAKNAMILETVAGRTITTGGKMAGGEWIDVVHGLDWLEARLGERVFGVLLADPSRKTPFTDAGIQAVVAEVRAQLQEGEDRGVLAAGWTVSYPRASALSSAQKATRQLPNVRFNATLAGAINTVQIRGTVAE